MLTTVITLNASDLNICVGQPAIVRHHECLCRLETKVLDGENTTALMKAITPDRCQHELQEKGRTEFSIAYGGNHFCCAVFKQKGDRAFTEFPVREAFRERAESPASIPT